VKRCEKMNPNNDMICVESIKKVMEIFGGKWSFLIIGELHEGTKRFNEMNRNLGISTKALSDALKSLESNGIITRTVYSTSPVTVEYSLTDKGRDFERVFIAMREWGMKWLKEDV
jgi:DNA-binding HxlR family transcriptional regulator